MTFTQDETALLALLEGCDMAEDVNAIPDLRVGAQLDVNSNLKSSSKRKSNNCWRLERRKELKKLQETEKQLLSQLQKLKISMRLQSRNKKPFRSILDGGEFPNWEQICERQELRRHQSEEENLKLKDEVKRRLWQAKTLLQRYKRRMRNEVVGASMELRRRYQVDGRGVTPPTDNDAVFDELMCGVDEMYADADIFFDRIKMHELPCPGRKNVTSTSRTEGKFVEFLDCHAVPFDLQSTVKAIWTCLREEEPQNPKPALVQFYDEDDNTLKQSMCSSFTAGCVHVRVMIRKAGRKYVEHDRAVFVFQRLIEPVDTDVHIAFYETTRLIVRPGPPSDLGPTSVIQSHRQATANQGDAYAMGIVHKVPRTFIDMGVAAWQGSITRFNHFVEDTLMRDSQRQ